jgi:hypothetical protein
MLRALRGEQTDGTPAAPAYLMLFLADFQRAYYIEQYRLRTRGQSRYAVDHEEDTRFRAQALYQACGIFKVQPDWMEVRRGASRAWAARTDIVTQDGVLHYEDRETGQRLPMYAVPVPRGDARLMAQNKSEEDLWDTSKQVQSREQIDALIPVRDADTLLARGDLDLPRRVVADYGERYFISTVLDTPYSYAYDYVGFQGLMLMPHDNRELFHYLLARQLAQTQAEMEAWAATGIDGVYVEEVFSGADLISPRAYDEFVFDYNRPYFRHMSGLGLMPIHYVCGDVVPRLDRIAQLDIAAVAVEESKKAFVIEIDEVVERAGDRVAVFGNIDAVRYGLNGTMAEMAAETRRQMRAGARARGFVVSMGSPFPLDTNPRVIDAMVATAHGA